MSSALIALAIVLLLSHFRPDWIRLRRLEPAREALRSLAMKLKAGSLQSLPGVLVQILLPGALLWALQWWIADLAFGLPHLLLATAVLFLCWGPRDLEADVHALREAADSDARASAKRALGLDPASEDAAAAVGQLFRVALERWFGTVFWFVALGGAGALIYRLLRMSDRECSPGSALASLRIVFDWPAAQLMALALAVVGNFDSVLHAWQSWHRERGKGWFVADLGFLDAAARCSVATERREHREELEDDEAPTDAIDDTLGGVLADALALLWRMLLAWLVVLALLVIAGVAS